MKIDRYKRIADSSLLLNYPVSIQGQRIRQDNDVQYHLTIMWTRDLNHLTEIQRISKGIDWKILDPNTPIKFDQFHDSLGNTIHYIIKLVDNKVLDSYSPLFRHLTDSAGEYLSHITIDKETWERLKSKNPRTVKEGGIEFDFPCLMQGTRKIEEYMV